MVEILGIYGSILSTKKLYIVQSGPIMRRIRTHTHRNNLFKIHFFCFKKVPIAIPTICLLYPLFKLEARLLSWCSVEHCAVHASFEGRIHQLGRSFGLMIALLANVGFISSHLWACTQATLGRSKEDPYPTHRGNSCRLGRG